MVMAAYAGMTFPTSSGLSPDPSPAGRSSELLLLPSGRRGGGLPPPRRRLGGGDLALSDDISPLKPEHTPARVTALKHLRRYSTACTRASTSARTLCCLDVSRLNIEGSSALLALDLSVAFAQAPCCARREAIQSVLLAYLSLGSSFLGRHIAIGLHALRDACSNS